MNPSDAVGPSGSVVVYNASFERRVLEDLALLVPSLEAGMPGIRDRIRNQHEVVMKHAECPDFPAHKSIKRVLPALVPDLGYSGLEIADGRDGGAMWLRLIERRVRFIRTHPAWPKTSRAPP